MNETPSGHIYVIDYENDEIIDRFLTQEEIDALPKAYSDSPDA